MGCIRLLFVGLPRLLGDILKVELQGHADMEIVAEAVTLDRVAEVAGRTGPDLIVVATSHATLPQECRSLMYRNSHTSTMSIAEDGTKVSLYRLRLHRVAVEETSPQGIVGAIRRAARGRLYSSE